MAWTTSTINLEITKSFNLFLISVFLKLLLRNFKSTDVFCQSLGSVFGRIRGSCVTHTVQGTLLPSPYSGVVPDGCIKGSHYQILILLFFLPRTLTPIKILPHDLCLTNCFFSTNTGFFWVPKDKTCLQGIIGLIALPGKNILEILWIFSITVSLDYSVISEV